MYRPFGILSILTPPFKFLSKHWCPYFSTYHIFFVTRQKGNATYTVIEERDGYVHPVLKDEIIIFTGTGAAEKCPFPIRRIEFYNAEKEQIMVFLTNNMSLDAQTVADVYKDRWQIELFFKALKQNLKIKTFVGTTANAVKIQIWTALIAMLILRYCQLKASFCWSLSNLVALLRMNLFTHRDFWRWLDEPYETPPLPYEQEQTNFAF